MRHETLDGSRVLPRHVPLTELVVAIAALRSVEHALFERFGAWALETDEAALKPVLATWSHQHAWHVSLWDARMPVIPGREQAELAVEGPLAAVDHELAELDVRGRLDALFLSFVPDQELRCRRLRDEVDPVLDPSTVRVCDLVLADLAAERSLAMAILERSDRTWR